MRAKLRLTFFSLRGPQKSRNSVTSLRQDPWPSMGSRHPPLSSPAPPSPPPATLYLLRNSTRVKGDASAVVVATK